MRRVAQAKVPWMGSPEIGCVQVESLNLFLAGTPSPFYAHRPHPENLGLVLCAPGSSYRIDACCTALPFVANPRREVHASVVTVVSIAVSAAKFVHDNFLRVTRAAPTRAKCVDRVPARCDASAYCHPPQVVLDTRCFRVRDVGRPIDRHGVDPFSRMVAMVTAQRAK